MIELLLLHPTKAFGNAFVLSQNDHNSLNLAPKELVIVSALYDPRGKDQNQNEWIGAEKH